MDFYRVFPWVKGARKNTPGHPLHVPQTQGLGRVDNPEYYSTLYVADSAAGAVAESFGNHAVWTDQLLSGRPGFPGSTTALVQYKVNRLRILDLDDAAALLERNLKPSQVVTRDRAITQAWSLALFRERRWHGVRWWSYYEPAWGAHGVWNYSDLEVARVEQLSRAHPALLEAAAVLNRPWQEIGSKL